MSERIKVQPPTNDHDGLIDYTGESIAPVNDDAIVTEPFTATMIADELNVDPKAFRSFWRAITRKRGGTVGVDTPGSGARYSFNVPVDDAMRAAYFDAMRTAYTTHRRTNNALTVDVSDVLGLNG